jgi:hypothetical protein
MYTMSTHPRVCVPVFFLHSCFPDKEKFVPGPLRRFIRGELVHQEKWFYDTQALSAPPYVLRFQQIPPLVGASADITGAYSDEKVANRDTKVWHFVIENGY